MTEANRVCRALAEAGADLNALNNEGQTPAGYHCYVISTAHLRQKMEDIESGQVRQECLMAEDDC
jgi:hypothetical protein